MIVQNHIHTYVKYKTKPGYFKCDAPDCTYWIEKELLLNKFSLCTICGSQFKLTREDLRRSRPRCLDCSNTQKSRARRKTFDLARDLGTDSFNPFNLPQQLNFSQEEKENDDY